VECWELVEFIVGVVEVEMGDCVFRLDAGESLLATPCSRFVLEVLFSILKSFCFWLPELLPQLFFFSPPGRDGMGAARVLVVDEPPNGMVGFACCVFSRIEPFGICKDGSSVPGSGFLAVD